MSHFTVLVIGENVEQQLAPYQENNMGDCPKKYLEFNDIEDESKKNYEEKYKEKYQTFEEYMNKWEGYRERDKEMNRYGYWENPNRKWDWYVVGGRWSGSLRLKTGEVSDSALVEDIDFSPDQDQYARSFRFWEVVIDKQPLKSGEDENNFFNLYKEEYYTKRFKSAEEYAAHQAEFTTFAVLKDGKWYEKGEMGWWGCSSETIEDDKKWNKSYYDTFIKELPKGTRLTVVDCHI